MNTKELLENISDDCLSQLTKYKYNESLHISKKYREAKVTSYEYVLELIYHFYEKDKQLKLEFENILTSQIEDISILKDGDYKQGMQEVLFLIKKQLSDKK